MPDPHAPSGRPGSSTSDDSPLIGGEVVEVELAQGLGLMEALTIGVGTMIGAGIFVLPGFIVARAGPAAVLSFALGAVVALLNAMSAAEVATGMPKSGGGYYVISRALGPLWGAIIGWGSWFGLIFATAFYMVGFAEYTHTVVRVPVSALAIVMTALLVVLNLTGSKAAGQAQNLIVVALVAVLAIFIARGAASADPLLITRNFMPFGLGAVAAGTATLFVTYCGFGEIASMAEEIRDPGRNLPRALLGAVIAVSILYCIVIVVCLDLRPFEELTGPTVVADLAADLMGPAGRILILVGAVLATVSSANASIMSASRISFAMGRDRLVSEWLNNVHPRFRVPHRAILLTGALTLAVILIGRIELLAEAAGFLHLLLYGLMSIAGIVLRGARLPAYRPAYRVPLYPVVPLLGALGSLAIGLFMAPLTLALGLAPVAFAVGHYWLYGRRRSDLRGGWPHFLRRGLLEPALERAEAWGAEAEAVPTAIVAVAHPDRELARLKIAQVVLGRSRCRVLAANVFVTPGAEDASDDILAGCFAAIRAREETLRGAASSLGGTIRVESHVPVSTSVFYGLLSAVEASSASMLLVGWPEPAARDPEHARLLQALDRHVRAHVIVVREHEPVPAARLLAIVDDTRHGELALHTGANLANAWGAELTVAAMVDPGAAAEDVASVEEQLEARVGDLARATIAALGAQSAGKLAQYAELCDMLIVGVSAAQAPALAWAVAELDHLRGLSLLVVRAHPEHPIGSEV